MRILVLLLCFVLTGCQPFEMTARDAIVTAGAFLRQAQANHLEECLAYTKFGVNLGKSDVLCPAITKAVSAHNIAVSALDAYCASPDYENGGPCVPNKELQPKVEAALRELESVLAELKRLL